MRRLLFFTALPLFSAVLLAQPTAPTGPRLDTLREETTARHRPTATVALSVNPSSREEVRQFYRAVYNASSNVPIAWTGSHTTGDAGTTSAAFKEAVLLRINFFRAMAGVPAAVTLNAAVSAKAQQAALMMSANTMLSHFPTPDWTFYTAEGAEAAANSNLAIGSYGPEAIDGYISDAGDNNAAVGHRRWLFYPQTREMGTGDVTRTDTLLAANATWVFDAFFGSARPATRTPYVAWPSPGYVPADLIYPRWSFSYPDANFSNATVTMTRDGATVPVELEELSDGAGENTLVWVYGNLRTDTVETPTVTTDSTFRVTLANVVVNGAPQTFTYDVIAFDPDRTGPDTQPVTVTGSTTAAVGTAAPYTIVRPSFTASTEWRSLQFDNAIPVYDAENSLDGLTAATTGSYTPRSTATVASGTASYQLATATFDDQYLLSPETFFAPAAGSPQLTLQSRLGWASSGQFARVQISTNDGISWNDVYTQNGTGNSGEANFSTRTVSLASVAGLTFRVRFAYTYTRGISAFTQTDPGVGWFFDNVTLTGVQRVAATSDNTHTANTGFAYTPLAAGSMGLQARGLFFHTYPLEWGPVKQVTVVAGPTFSTQPTHQSVAAGQSVALSASATTGSTFRWQYNGSDVAGAASSSLTITDLQPAKTGLYTALATRTGATTTSNAAIVGLNTDEKVIGDGFEISADVPHPNTNIFDQVLLTGPAESITADIEFNQITRTSYIDLDDDIVQVEFSGPGTLSLVLDTPTDPAPPLNYNQPGVSYMKGHAGIVITGANEFTNVSVFTVGRATAFDRTGAYNILQSPSATNIPANNGSPLFAGHAATNYDGIADIAFIAIASTNGKFGGLRTSNANYFASKGLTGVYAPGVAFQGPVFIGDVTAFESATPIIIIGSSADTRITGGNLSQANGAAVRVSGLTQLKFTPGGDSHGTLLPAQNNQAVLRDSAGTDVTTQIVVNP